VEAAAAKERIMNRTSGTENAVATQQDVKFLDRSAVLYMEGPRSLKILVEYLGDHTVLLYLKKLLAWDAPFQSTALAPVDKERVRAALRKAYAAEHMKVEFDDEVQGPA
jgi:hypothetical protein